MDKDIRKHEKKAARQARRDEATYWKQEMERLIRDEKRTQLPFPPTLSKAQRKVLHRYASNIGLKSRSTGTGNNRFLTVFKKNAVPFLPTCDGLGANIQISDKSIEIISNLLAKDPLTNAEKEICVLKPTENESNFQLPFTFGDGKRQPRFCVPPIPRHADALKATRESLPIYSYRRNILDAINDNPVVVISGETGSGKTTQVPQYIMEDCAKQKKVCRIICTQPRRLAATSIADRVSQERNDTIGKSVGYQIRLDNRVSAETNLIFTTSGYLLRCLTGSKSGEIFKSVTHLLLDEVHEREKITDFLLIAIKDGLEVNPNLKVVLMSATLDSEMFSEYFFKCPVIDVPGRTFDVDVKYLGEILTMTKYTNKHMQAYMTENKGPKILRQIDSAASDQKCQSTASLETTTQTQATAKNDSRNVAIPEEDIEFFDECLDGCLESDLDAAFEQIYYLITDENMPVDYLHSQKSRSALTIAAEKGFYHVITTLLSFGSNPAQCEANGFSPLDYAKQNSHEDCVHLLEQYERKLTVDPTENESNEVDAMAEATRKALEQFTLAAYQVTNDRFNEIDHDLLLILIKHLHLTNPTDGSILVFLPGYDDIMRQKDLIESRFVANNYQLFVLHSGLNATKSSEQRRVFQRLPHGQRKIILSTNIAETSLTIDDVVYVVDAGKVKQQTYDSISDTTCLTSTWISQACAKQRAGRAGRVRNGHCYRMYSLEHFETMEKYTLPEILRVPLTEICLNAKILAGTLSIEEFLLKALQPPPVQSIRQSINLLKKIDALDAAENITYLGIHLANLPVDAQLGKCILYSVLLKCVDPVVTIVSALSVKDPFMLPLGDEGPKITAIKKLFANNSLSDHQMLLKTYTDWLEKRQSHSEKKFCKDNMISTGNMEMIHGVRKLVLGHLHMVGILCEDSARNERQLNQNSSKWEIVKACLTAGLYPNVGRIDPLTGKIYSKHDKKLLPHLSSVLRERTSKNQIDPNVVFSEAEWLIHGEKSRISHYSLIRNITVVAPINIILFTGAISLPETNVWTLQIGQWNTEDVDEDDADDDDDPEDCEYNNIAGNQEATFTVDDWICFSLNKIEADLLFGLRQKFNSIFVKLLKDPSSFSMTNQDNRTLTAVVNVMENEDYLTARTNETTLSRITPTQTNATNNRKQLNPIPNTVNSSYDAKAETEPPVRTLPAYMSASYNEALQPENRRNKKKNNRKNKRKKEKKSKPEYAAMPIPLQQQFQPPHSMSSAPVTEKTYAANTSDLYPTFPSTENNYSPYEQFYNNNQQQNFARASSSSGYQRRPNLIQGLFNQSIGPDQASSSSFNNHEFNNHEFNNHEFNNHKFNNHEFNNHEFNNSNNLPMQEPSLPMNHNVTRYFVLTIRDVGKLYQSVYAKRWFFNMPFQDIRRIEQESPSAKILVFFYVQNKSAIFGAGHFFSFSNKKYNINCPSGGNGYSLRPIKYMPVQSDYEMDPYTGRDLLDYCRRALA